MATQTGKFLNVGFTGTDGLVETTMTGKILLQSANYEVSDTEAQTLNAAGDLVNRTFTNPMKKATLEVIPVSATDVAGSITNHTALLALRHTIISITTCTSMPELVQTNWFVTSTKSAKSNTEASKVTLELEAHAAITASAA
jgi:hypothetical protein